ncbi:STAS domain-containing protein [Streptomyces sp. NPDC005180]|uniref:STAS domain-containing protein n=1 Tax=Streptomyces sp. NPDC005180 TaxID=3156868 RepID=UPI0033A88B52
MPLALIVDVAPRADHITVTVTGELDMETCPDVTKITEALSLDGKTLTVDLSAVTFMDSSGLNALLRLRSRAQTEAASLRLAGVPDQALRVLDLTGTRQLFTLSPPPHG